MQIFILYYIKTLINREGNVGQIEIVLGVLEVERLIIRGCQGGVREVFCGEKQRNNRGGIEK